MTAELFQVMMLVCPGEMIKSRRQKAERLRVVDWEHPADNDFLLVSQFSVTGAAEMPNDEFRLSK